METDINFGLKIRELLKQRGISKTNFAEMIGYSLPGLTKVLDKEDVNTEILKKVCNLMNVEMDYFLSSRSITQTGNYNMIGKSTNSFNNTTATNQPELSKIQMLESENNHLKGNIEHLKDKINLLEQMIELLKSKA